MKATPETFKPGERWLFEGGAIIETICVEWSPSGSAVLVRYPGASSGYEKQWRDPSDLGEMRERLPDVESGNHKTESPRRLETDSLVRFAKLFIVNWPCACDHCKVQKAKAYSRIEEIEKEIFESAETKC